MQMSSSQSEEQTMFSTHEKKNDTLIGILLKQCTRILGDKNK